MEKETKHTPETLWEKMAREDWLAGEGFSGKFDGLSRVPHIFKPRIFEFAESYSASLQTELSEMKAAYEKDANKLMAERDYFKNLCEEKDKVIEDYSYNLKPLNELKAELEKHMRELFRNEERAGGIGEPS